LAEPERVQTAFRLWQGDRAPIILTTGRGEAPRLSAQLTQLGVPLSAQIVEPQARTAEENAIRASELLQTIGASRLILVTDQPHMLRSVLTFKSFGFQVIPHPVIVPLTVPAMQRTTLALREYAGLVSYALIGRFQPRPFAAAPETLPQRELVADEPSR